MSDLNPQPCVIAHDFVSCFQSSAYALLCYIIHMDKYTGPDAGLKAMLADHMEAGFLENIIDMFRHDSSLYALIGDLIQDERVRVRIGTTALMEELRKLDKGNISGALPALLPLTAHHDAVVRGDISNLLGIVASKEALPFLEKLLSDENPSVRLIAKEAIGEINQPAIQ